jgi:hypothetical protein
MSLPGTKKPITVEPVRPAEPTKPDRREKPAPEPRREPKREPAKV